MSDFKYAIGDEVLFTPNPSINKSVLCEVSFIGKKHVILTSRNGREYSRMTTKARLEKPSKTLRDKAPLDVSGFNTIEQSMEKRIKRNKSKQACAILKSLDYEYDLDKQKWYKKQYV